jgi:hypothetical protein
MVGSAFRGAVSAFPLQLPSISTQADAIAGHVPEDSQISMHTILFKNLMWCTWAQFIMKLDQTKSMLVIFKHGKTMLDEDRPERTC